MNLQEIRQALAFAKDAKDYLEDKLDQKEADREALKRERDIIAGSWLPREQVIEDIDGRLDIIKEEFLSRIKWNIHNPSGGLYRLAHVNAKRPEAISSAEDALPHILNLGPANKNQVSQNSRSHFDAVCLVGLLSDQIKPLMREAIMNAEWPGPEGLTRKERDEKLADIDSQIKALTIEIEKLYKDAEEAGITF